MSTYAEYLEYFQNHTIQYTENDDAFRRMTFKEQIGAVAHKMVTEGLRYSVAQISKVCNIRPEDVILLYAGFLSSGETLETFDKICEFCGVRPAIQIEGWDIIQPKHMEEKL